MAAAAPAVPYPGSTPQEAEAVGRVVRCAQDWERGMGQEFRLKCDRFYEQYRGFRTWEDEWTRTNGENDRDGLIRDAQDRWGAKLHIPLSFRTIETVVPRAIANAPKMLYLPRDEQWRQNLQNVQMLLNWQQEQINIDLPFQAVMRNGQIYGLGIGKTFWDKKVRMVRAMTPRTQEKPAAQLEPGESATHYLAKKPKTVFDGPRFENLDVYDFLWDPYGYDMETCDWTAQRIWLSLEQVVERLPQNGGAWNTPSAEALDEEAIRKLPGGDQQYTTAWSRRMQASGFSVKSFSEYGQQIHEAIEYHDGTSVWTVLDRQVLVAAGDNPCGEMPFQIYRPTPLDHQMVGIGALEPLEHLQRELDTLRSQRRDLVTLALAGGYAFDTNMLREEDLTFGPTSAIEVDGDPRAALMPLGVKEVPGAGWQEENSIRTDIEAVSGMSDALDNSPAGQSSTATEAQLVQAALGRRIELGARRFELEIVAPAARQFLYLDQQMIRQTRALMVPGQEPEPIDSDSPPYKVVQIGPGEIEGDFEIVVEGGSMAARNIPQDRSDANGILNALQGNWFINPTKPLMKFLELYGIKHPQAWLRDPEPSIPQATLRFLLAGGVDPALVSAAVIRAREVTAPQEGPSAQQITDMGVGGGEPQR